MCQVVTVAIVLGLLILAPAGVSAWVAFLASSRKHRVDAEVAEEGLRDDAGLTAFERAHFRKVIVGGFADQPDADLRALAASARRRLLLSAAIAMAVVTLLVVRTSAQCS